MEMSIAMSEATTVILLAVIQGLTEFLPVSSSGHLAVLSALCGLKSDTGLSLGIVLHAGSLLAIAAFYFRLLLGFFRKDQRHLLGMVIVGSIPAGVAGILLKKSGLIDAMFGDMMSVALGFLITASLLRLTGKAKLTADSRTEVRDISLRQALTAGAAQMFAIVPGISRSGSTIAAGILSGMKREAAAAFSFLLALPAIAGASLLEMIELAKNGFDMGSFSLGHLGLGFAVSALVSFAALSLLIRLIRGGKLAYFAWYLFLLGAGIMVWQIVGMMRGMKA